jgi:hypothetical protein
MSWLFSQALVEEYLGDTYLDGEPSALSNGKPTQQAYCAPDKMTKFSRLSRFGMMCKPLTESLGEELLMSYLGDFHAKTSPLLEKAQELKAKEVQCGDIWQESLGKLDPNTHLWKTAQCSLLEDLEQSLQTFPRWGSMRNGVCFQRPMLAQITLENGFGLLPRIPDNVNFFHTPTTGQDGGSNSRKALKKRMGMWPTPTVGCVEGGEQSNRVERTLGGGYILRKLNKPNMTYGAKLSDAVLFEEKQKQVINGGKLNPNWTEWLMGWPTGWTDLKPLETDKSLFVQQQLGDS